VEDHDPQGNVDLGGGQPRSVDVPQRLDHVRDQRPDGRGGRVGHLVGPAAQHRMAHARYLQDCHGRQYGTRPIPGKALAKIAS
jgi:hypothetical protein